MRNRVPVEAALEELGLDFSVETAEKLSEFIAILHKWNKTHNLVGKNDLRWLVDYLLVDSLLPLKFLNIAGRDCFDVGSGNGFPGIILAVAGKPAIMYLIEKKKKKASFLKFVASSLDLKNIKVVDKRFEEAKLDRLFDFGFSKALAKPDAVWELVKPALKEGGTMVVWAGAESENCLSKIPSSDAAQIIVKKYYFQKFKKTTSLIMIVKKVKG